MPGEAWKAFTVALGVNERKSAAPALLFTLLLLSPATADTKTTENGDSSHAFVAFL